MVKYYTLLKNLAGFPIKMYRTGVIRLLLFVCSIYTYLITIFHMHLMSIISSYLLIYLQAF